MKCGRILTKALGPDGVPDKGAEGRKRGRQCSGANGTYSCARGHQVDLVEHENKMFVWRFGSEILLDVTATKRVSAWWPQEKDVVPHTISSRADRGRLLREESHLMSP